jgi:hypothetical protein
MILMMKCFIGTIIDVPQTIVQSISDRSIKGASVPASTAAHPTPLSAT